MSRSKEAIKRARREQAKAAKERGRRRRERMRQARIGAISVLLVAAVVGVGLVLVRTGSGGVAFAGDFTVGGRIERLSLPELEGDGTIDYAELSERPLVINFFAFWCPFCIAEMPDFERVHQELGSRVAFLGVSQSDSRGASVDLAHQTGISYPAAMDAQGAFFNAVGTGGIPTTLLVEPGGRIAYVQVGPLTADSLKELIGRYLGVRV